MITFAPQTRWYYGWNIVAAASLITLLTFGMRMGIGPLFLPMAQDLGFSRSLLAGIVAAGMMCYGAGMPLAGWMVTRWGTRFVLLLGAVLMVVATLWVVSTRSPWGVFASFGVLMSLGSAFTSSVAMTPVITRWFQRRRGMALFFVATGSVAGIAVLTPVLGLALQHLSWQQTLLGFLALFLCITVPSALWIVRDDAPEGADAIEPQAGAQAQGGAGAVAPQEHLSATQAMRTGTFVKISLGLFACGFSMNLLGTHAMPMLMDHGFDATTSSLGIGLIGLVAIPSTLVLGRLADRIQRRSLLSTIYFVRGLGFLGLLIASSKLELFATSTVGGLVWAGTVALSSAILADVYGVRLVGVLNGWAYVGHQIGATLGSGLGGWAFDQTGSHWPAFGSAALLLFLASAITSQVPARELPPPRVRTRPAPAR